MSFTNELTTILASRLHWHKSRLECFCQLISALMMVRTVNLKRIALAMSTPANSDSNYRRLQRFFKQFKLDPDQLARVIYDLFANAHPDHYLIIDRTNWKWGKRDINILMLAISWGNTAIPLMWTVINTPGISCTSLRQQLIRRYLKHFDIHRLSGLLADREFIGKAWFAFLINQHIPLYIRLKQDFLVTNHYGRVANIGKLLRHVNPGETHVMPKQRLLWGQRVWITATRNHKNELIIIASTGQPDQALALYTKRWGIENLFQCLKSRGFEFECTRMTHPERITKMIGVLAIAFSLALITGQWREQNSKSIRVKKHQRPEISVFRYGLDYLQRILFTQKIVPSFRSLLNQIAVALNTKPLLE